MDVQFFSNDLVAFIDRLDKPTISKVLRSIDLLRDFGNALRMPHSRYIGYQLFELRIRGQQEVRIIYAFQNESAILIHGYVKKSQHMPKREFLIAQKRLQSI